MRLALWAILLSACATADAALAADATKPPVRITTIGVQAAGDTVRARWVYRTPGLGATDTAVVTWTQKLPPSTTWATIKTSKTRGTTDQVVVALATDSIRACVQVTRAGAQPSPSSCAQIGRVLPPPPSVDSLTVAGIIVKPDSVKLLAVAVGAVPTAANQQQFCAYVRLTSGHVALRAAQAAIPTCQTLYQTFSQTERAVTLAEQVVADRVCVAWTATGGTIAAAVCGSPA
jgi:hypothetical protein